jgi:hypothetical protein
MNNSDIKTILDTFGIDIDIRDTITKFVLTIEPDCLPRVEITQMIIDFDPLKETAFKKVLKKYELKEIDNG